LFGRSGESEEIAIRVQVRGCVAYVFDDVVMELLIGIVGLERIFESSSDS
jgi:hypothetical protein